jgi:hypothetical protein
VAHRLLIHPVMNSRNIALLFASLVTTAPTLGCVPAPFTDDDIVDVDELRALEIRIDRDGSGDHYPRTLSLGIQLPWPHRECAVLDPAMTFTLNGRPPLFPVSRGGVSPIPGYFGGEACEDAIASFRVPDEGGPLIVRIEQEGFEPAVIELDAPALEPLELVAPADGHLRPGDVARVRVPASFYTSRNLTPPGPHALGSSVIGDNPEPFAQTLLVARGQDLAHYQSDRVIGGVGVGAEDLLAEIPSYTKPGPKSLYVAYTYASDFAPMAIRRCDGFAVCKGQARDNFGVLGPIEVIVE